VLKSYRFVTAVAAALLYAWCGSLHAQQASSAASSAPEQVLTSRELVRVGNAYLLKADINLSDALRPVRDARERVLQVERDRLKYERDIRDAQRKVADWRAQYEVLDAKIKKTRDPANHNQYVKPINALADKINAGLKFLKETNTAISALPDLRPQYAQAVVATARMLDAVDARYDALAEDAAVRAAMDALNKPRPNTVTLGPSPLFRRELFVLRLTRRSLDPNAYVVKFGAGRSGGALVEATLNGSTATGTAEPMAVDADAAYVVIAPAAAAKLGLRAAADARTTKLRTPGGKLVDAKLAVLASVQVGPYAVRDVEFALYPGDAAASPANSVLGKSFLKHFAPDGLNASAAGVSLIPLPDAPVRVTPGPAANVVAAPQPDNIFDESADASAGGKAAPRSPTTRTADAPDSRAGETVRLPLPVPVTDVAAAVAARTAIDAGGRVRNGEVLTEAFEFDPGEPYRLNGTFKVDDNAKSVDVTIGPGAEVRGGKIYLARGGHLKVQGTPDRPAVLRGVHISMDLSGTFDAEYAVLDGCTFSKGGGWFAYHSSKWTFRNCTLYKCKFAGLTGVDYGFKIESCRLIGMTFPEIQPRRDKDKEFNHLSHLRHSWNRIRGCEFVDCTVPPTVAWCAEGATFVNCTFPPGQAFEGAEDFVWEAFVAGTKGELPQAVFDANPGSRGRVRAASLKQPPELPILGERLVPEITYSDRSVKRDQ
jgi:hypothetical protein